MEVRLPEWNRGYQLLRLMGWKEATGLGKRGEGIVDPVRLREQYAHLGLGKATEYEERAEEATESRRAMMAELIANEDEEGREARVAGVARQEAVADAKRRELSVFYCEVSKMLAVTACVWRMCCSSRPTAGSRRQGLAMRKVALGFRRACPCER